MKNNTINAWLECRVESTPIDKVVGNYGEKQVLNAIINHRLVPPIWHQNNENIIKRKIII